MKMAAPTPHSSTMIKLMGQVMRDRSSAIGFNERQHAANDLPHPLAHSPTDVAEDEEAHWGENGRVFACGLGKKTVSEVQGDERCCCCCAAGRVARVRLLVVAS